MAKKKVVKKAQKKSNKKQLDSNIVDDILKELLSKTNKKTNSKSKVKKASKKKPIKKNVEKKSKVVKTSKSSKKKSSSVVEAVPIQTKSKSSKKSNKKILKPKVVKSVQKGKSKKIVAKKPKVVKRKIARPVKVVLPKKKQLRKLVVYYSFDGSTKLVAETIAKEVGADLLELKTRSELLPRNFTKYFWGGKMVIMKEKPDLLPFSTNPYIYDVIFIGTPVWVFSFAPPLRSFFSKMQLKDKDVALFCCHGGSKGKTIPKLKHELKGNQFVGEASFVEPVKRNTAEQLESAKKWAKQIVKNCE